MTSLRFLGPTHHFLPRHLPKYHSTHQGKIDKTYKKKQGKRIPVCTAERRVLTFSTKPSIQDNFESLLQSATTCNYKVRQFIFLQSARTCYYKVRQLFCYKLRQVLLQRATGITKCDNFITKCDRYYKVRRL